MWRFPQNPYKFVYSFFLIPGLFFFRHLVLTLTSLCSWGSCPVFHRRGDILLSDLLRSQCQVFSYRLTHIIASGGAMSLVTPLFSFCQRPEHPIVHILR